MPAEFAEAIVIDSVPFSNTSLIVTLFTKEYGKFSALAKGARREKNPFDNGLDAMARLKTVYYPRHEGLQLLTQASLLRWFRVDRRNLPALYAGYYVIELLDTMTVENDPSPQLFDLVDQTLGALTRGAEVWRVLLRFQWQLLVLVGSIPDLQKCACCGNDPGPQSSAANRAARIVKNTYSPNVKKNTKNLVWLDLIGGTIVCDYCYSEIRNRQQASLSQTVGRKNQECSHYSRKMEYIDELVVENENDSELLNCDSSYDNSTNCTQVQRLVCISNVVLQMMRQFANPNSRLWEKLKPSIGDRQKMRTVTDAYFAHLLGWRPKMQKFNKMFI